jgi:NAD(P)-dependent dehydrogenase (short-subunit alcohol dehydrogenase family)
LRAFRAADRYPLSLKARRIIDLWPLWRFDRRFPANVAKGHPVRLKDKIAVVTGGGRGIGRDIVLAYAREGAHVVVNDIDPATAEATAKDAAALGSNSLAVVADVAKSGDINRLIETAVKERGRVDILVNNAMKIVPGKLEALPEEAWDTTMNIGLKGAFLVSQACARHMIAQKSGIIVNIASIAGLFPYNWAGAYSVVKAGLIMLTKLQAMEWAPYGIRANAITPGYIRTPGTEGMYADPEIYEGRRKGVPMGRVGSGEDIAGPAVFLACEESRYTTGSVLGADGGQAVGYFLTVPGRRFSGGSVD